MLGALALPGVGAQTTPRSKFEKYKLPNGLEVILHEDHSTPIVAVDTWYHVGSGDEIVGRTGFAHLFEHIMFMARRPLRSGRSIRCWRQKGATTTARRPKTAPTITKPFPRTRSRWRYGWTLTEWGSCCRRWIWRRSTCSAM